MDDGNRLWEHTRPRLPSVFTSSVSQGNPSIVTTPVMINSGKAHATILVVEDDSDIQELLDHNLKQACYSVITCATGEQALELVRIHAPDLVALDLMLPGMDGFTVCRHLKNHVSTHCIPILILTAKSTEHDIVTGLELGADDYLTKPFRPRELIARVRSILRRATEPHAHRTNNNVFSLDGIEINPGARVVKVNNEVIDLSYSELQVLHLLAQNVGRVFTRFQIADAVRGMVTTDHSVDTQISALRKKLGVTGRQIDTVRGIGYRMRDAGLDLFQGLFREKD